MSAKLKKLIKEILFNTRFRKFFFPAYTYNFTPPQLCFLCQCIEDTKLIAGAFSEIGCSTGATTLFLNKYMDAQGIEKAYYAIDTFSGFVSKDIEFEIENRGKKKNLYTQFQVNKKKWFDGTMHQNKIVRVRSIEADVNKFNLTTIGPLSFSLVDVDLYRPMKKALKEIYEILSPGGIIVVDDCDASDTHWDGSDQAYKEFVNEIGQEAMIVYNKLGVIKKPV